jgi:hypothetical protein
MEEIKTFLKALFSIEADALYLEKFKEKLQEYNTLAKKANCYTIAPIALLQEMDFPPYSDKFYEKSATAVKPIPRHIYKISLYGHPSHEKIWACYVSGPKPIVGATKSLTTCFIISEIDGQLKIIAEFKIDPDTANWKFVGGDRDIDYNDFGSPVNIERLLSPENNEESITEYLKDR